MPHETLTTDLFAATWKAGVAAVSDEGVDSLRHLVTIPPPTPAAFHATVGHLKREMDAVLDIGLSKIQRSGELPG